MQCISYKDVIPVCSLLADFWLSYLISLHHPGIHCLATLFIIAAVASSSASSYC